MADPQDDVPAELFARLAADPLAAHLGITLTETDDGHRRDGHDRDGEGGHASAHGRSVRNTRASAVATSRSSCARASIR